MAFMNNINKDMTAADARAVAGQQSWMDIFPEGFDPEQDPWDLVGEHRLYFDTHGQPHVIPTGNPFSGPLGKALRGGEKDGLLARKASGELEAPQHPDPEKRAKGQPGPSIRDTRGKNQREPVEWDHIVIGLSRAEAEALGPDGLKEWAKVVVGAIQDTPKVGGKRQMLVTGLHTDTDKVHLQILLHRIPVDEANKLVHATWEVSRNSEAADQMKQINTALIAAGLPVVHDFKNGGYSVVEDRVPSSEELARAAERVKDAGGVTPPDLTTGPIVSQRERVSPEMRHLDSMLAEAIKRQKAIEAEATSAATAVAAAQHAREALSQYEVEVKARVDAEALAASLQVDLEQKDIQIGVLQASLEKESADLKSANEAIEELAGQVDAQTRALAERDDVITGLNRGMEELRDLHRDEMQEAADLLATVEESRDQWHASYDAKVEDLKVEEARRREDNEAAATSIDELRRELETARGEAEKALQERTMVSAQLDAEKATREAVEAKFDAYRSQVEQADDFEGQPLPGDGMDAIGRDSRKAKADVVFPDGVQASKRLLGRQRFDLPDGGQVRTTRNSAKLTTGTLTPTAIAVMIAHAQREGWTPITVSARSPELVASITDAARRAGLVLEGDEPTASITAAPTATRRRSPPSWTTKAPASWSAQERTSAQRFMDSQKASGKIDQALPLETFGQKIFEQYQEKQNAGDNADGLKPRNP